MKHHTKNYMAFFRFQIPEDFVCELCGRQAVDLHHIQSRGMGGDPLGDKDHVSNLMALCREDHERFGDIPDKREWLREVHFKYMEAHSTARHNVGEPIDIVELIKKKK